MNPSSTIPSDLPPDYHMHTPLCRHAVGEPSAYAAQAVALGLKEIAFTDHSPMARDDFDDWRMRFDQLDDYILAVDQARREHPGLSIRIGLEVDYLPGQEDWIRRLANHHPWDVFIGSVHYLVDGWDIDNPFKISEWKRRPAAEVWSGYFARLQEAASSNLFDIIGHPDLCKKFAFYPEGDLARFYEGFLAAAADSGVAIEINTAGLRKECREMYPSQALLAKACALGIPLSFGSDAHDPGDVGANFQEAVSIAKAVGYRHSIRMHGRKRTFQELG